MNRYIDAEEALRMMRNSQQDNPCESQYKGIWHTAHESCISCVDAVPTAGVVEVVRCKDCKFNVENMKKDPLDITDYSGDDIVCSYFMTDGMQPDDFCSRGERREE